MHKQKAATMAEEPKAEQTFGLGALRSIASLEAKSYVVGCL